MLAMHREMIYSGGCDRAGAVDSREPRDGRAAWLRDRQRCRGPFERPRETRGGHLYGVLNRLSADGLITQTREEVVGGRRRRYYQLTGPGPCGACPGGSTPALDSGRGQRPRRGRPRPQPEIGMRRRLLDLCLLAYPRACRRRDRDYLRDLALESGPAPGPRPPGRVAAFGRGPGTGRWRQKVGLANRRGLAGGLGVGVRWVGGERGRAGVIMSLTGLRVLAPLRRRWQQLRCTGPEPGGVARAGGMALRAAR